MNDNSPEAIAERLERLRVALDFPTQTAFAHFLGWNSPSRLNNFLRGSGFSRMAEEQMVERIHGLSGGWLRYGDPSGLSVDLAKKLGELAGRSGTTSQSPRAGRRGSK